MLREIFWFETKFWLRGMMVWVFLAVVTILIFGAVASDNVQVGGTAESTYRNAPHSVQVFYGVISFLAGVMVTAFVNSAACRDFSAHTSPYVFSYPLRKVPYLLGRFTSAFLVSLIPMVGVSLGVILGSLMPWQEAERIGPTVWGAHLWGFFLIAAPNCLVIASLIFAIAIWTRSTIAAFLGMLLILIGYTIAGQLARNLDYESIAGLLDPFAISLYSSLTKYWTAAEMNQQYVAFAMPLIWNRLLWLTLSAVVVTFTIWRFSFTERSRSTKPEDADATVRRSANIPLPTAEIRTVSSVAQLRSQFVVDLVAILKSNVFRIVIGFAGFMLAINLIFAENESYGLASLPVTYKMIDIIRGSLYIFLLAIVTYYAGVLVWKERDAHLEDVYDALPHPTWLLYVGKLSSLVVVVFIVLATGILSGAVTQAAHGYHRYQWGVYCSELLGWDFARFVLLLVVAVLVHVVSPNKYLGYFGFVTFLVLNQFFWSLVGWESRMLVYGSLASSTYSDMFGVAPYLSSMLWFAAYWFLFAGLLALAAIFWWPRGKERGLLRRWRIGVRNWSGGLAWASAALLVAWVSCAGWVYYNTLVLNTWKSRKQLQSLAQRYETEFRDHAKFPQPRVTHIRYDIDIDPRGRGLELRGEQRMINRSSGPIERLYINTAANYDTTLDVPNAVMESAYEDLNYFIFKMNQPLAPGEEIVVRYSVRADSQGFENSLSHPEIVQNGTFFNNTIAPQFGYQPSGELTNPNERRRRGLPPPRRMPPLDVNDIESRSNHYISNHSDWVEVETVISTSDDQIAIAPGSLQRKWNESGRNYFHYRLDHPSLNFCSFMSARYQVAVRDWNGVSLEVYYHPDHHWNVEKMLDSMQATLEYCGQEFGPYRHRQARIIEFPRTATFAQAFPGTMPYSEGIGFIADLRDPEDIDMVYYVVAHEMGHQWWAHQVIGANMQGATVLSETLAQYTSLMVMERKYGRDMMRKFLRYEMDRYLRSRGSELLREQPLLSVEAQQGYVHYNKGSVVMYQLKEFLGEDRVNAALRALVDKFAYAPPPYPTSMDLYQALQNVCSAEHQPLLADLFENMVVYDLRARQASYSILDDGRYQVELEFECRKFRYSEAAATTDSPKTDTLSNQWLEVESPMDQFVEIGAFAAPPPGKKYGSTLHRQRVRAVTGTNVVSFIVAELPQKAGVDPFCLEIDRVPDDNLKIVSPRK